MMWLVLIPVVAMVSVFWLWIRSKDDRMPKGPKGWPLLGNALQINPNKLHFSLEEWAKEFGPIYKFSSMGTNVVVLSSPELIRKAFASDRYGQIMNDRPDMFLRKYWLKEFVGFMRYMYNKSLEKTRKVYHNALRLYGDGVAKFETTVKSEIVGLIQIIKAMEGEEVNPGPIFERSLANLVSILVIGEPVSDKDLKILWGFVQILSESLNPTDEFFLFNFPFVRFFPGKYRNMYRKLLKKTDELMNRYLKPYQETYKFGKERGLVDAFIRLQKEKDEVWMSNKWFEGLVASTIGAAMGTTISALLSIFLALINNVSCEDRIYEEIMAVIGNNRLPTLKDRGNMPYTEAFIMESMRVANMAPLLPPHNCMEDCEFEGFKIPKDTRIAANLWSVNRNPNIWGDPDVFRPERFLDDDDNLLPQELKLRQSWLFFGVGRRNCPGEMMARSRLFLYVTSLIQNFRFVPPEKEPLVELDSTKFSSVLVPRPPRYICKIEARP